LGLPPNAALRLPAQGVAHPAPRFFFQGEKIGFVGASLRASNFQTIKDDLVWKLL